MARLHGGRAATRLLATANRSPIRAVPHVVIGHASRMQSFSYSAPDRRRAASRTVRPVRTARHQTMRTTASAPGVPGTWRPRRQPLGLSFSGSLGWGAVQRHRPPPRSSTSMHTLRKSWPSVMRYPARPMDLARRLALPRRSPPRGPLPAHAGPPLALVRRGRGPTAPASPTRPFAVPSRREGGLPGARAGTLRVRAATASVPGRSGGGRRHLRAGAAGSGQGRGLGSGGAPGAGASFPVPRARAQELLPGRAVRRVARPSVDAVARFPHDCAAARLRGGGGPFLRSVLHGRVRPRGVRGGRGLGRAPDAAPAASLRRGRGRSGRRVALRPRPLPRRRRGPVAPGPVPGACSRLRDGILTLALRRTLDVWGVDGERPPSPRGLYRRGLFHRRGEEAALPSCCPGSSSSPRRGGGLRLSAWDRAA